MKIMEDLPTSLSPWIFALSIAPILFVIEFAMSGGGGSIVSSNGPRSAPGSSFEKCRPAGGGPSNPPGGPWGTTRSPSSEPGPGPFDSNGGGPPNSMKLEVAAMIHYLKNITNFFFWTAYI